MVPVPTALSPGEDRQLRHVGRDPSRLIFADPPTKQQFCAARHIGHKSVRASLWCSSSFGGPPSKHFCLTITRSTGPKGLVMSEQAEKFLAQWEIEHTKMVARSDREDQARRLALRCREDAARAGISSQDLEGAAEGNLIGNMLQALDDAEFRQMYRDQVAEQEED